MKYVYLIQSLTVPSQRYLARNIHEASAASTDTWLRRAVSLRVCALSRRTCMNIAGYGITANLDERLRVHNAGRSPHTSKYRLWKFVLHLCFQDEQRAGEFERYLKSGSGHAFAKKRFW